MPTLDELTTPLTKEEVKANIYTGLGTQGVNTTTWKSGAVYRTIIALVSIIIAAGFLLQATVARMGFLELSSGDWLTLVAKYVFGVTRIDATFASGQATMVNSAGGSFPYGVGDLTFRNPATNKLYRNTAAGTLAPLATQTIAITAIEAGADSTSVPNSITAMVTPLIGVTCYNAISVVGQDAETDSALRGRASAKLGSLSPNGPWDAYTFAARNAKLADGTAVGITRVRINKDGLGNVDVFVATATGGITGFIGDLTTQIGAVDDAIQRLAAPLAVTANSYSATNIATNIAYQVWLYNTSGLTNAQIEARIATQLTNFFAEQPVGGNVIGGDPGRIFTDTIKSAIASTRTTASATSALLPIFRVEITTPALDYIDLAMAHVAVPGTITATAINQVPPTEGQP